jgi:hypothetical protein
MEGVEIFKKPDFVERWGSQHKPRRALEKFRESGADPAFPEERLTRVASATRMFVRLKKAEVKVRNADRARQAERVRPCGQCKPAESANREVTLQSERNAPGNAAMPPAKRRRNADSLWAT